jgi:hypothetical protein
LDDLDFGELESAPAGETPDWLSAMAAPEPEQATSPAASLDDLDFGELESTPAEPAGETPDWLSMMAAPEPEQATSPVASLDDLDFGELESAPAEPVSESVSGEEPDWLSSFGGDSEPLADTQSAARHAMPEHFPEVDLSKLPEQAADDESSNDFAFSFNRVAQHADLVNTNTDSESFTFQRKPAWMRKAKSTKGK